MTQFEFDVICKVINNGAPALAGELINSLSTVITDYNSAVAENATLKAEVERMRSESCDNCECPNEKCCEDK